MDRFGRVIDQNWYNTGTSSSNERFQYGYDQDGNVLYKNNLIASSFSELYHSNSGSSGDDSSAYDPLGRLTTFRRGTLTSSGNNSVGLDTVTTGNLNTIASDDSTSWSLDALGNQASVNSKNQLTASHFAYDNNGNMIEDGAEHTFVYDAWNRLVGGSQLSHDYSYDALGRRIGYSLDNVHTRDDYYYSADGHDIEDRYCNGITDQYVWGLGGPNELILRDSNDSDNTGYGGNLGKASSDLAERIYVEQDANENVTALVGPTGTMLQHFVYDPYGAVRVINAGYTATTTDSCNWVYLFQGGRLDPTTGLYRFGVRDYSPSLGRWTEADPAGYINGPDMYQGFLSNPLMYTDPSGTDVDGMSSVQDTTAAPPATQPGPGMKAYIANHEGNRKTAYDDGRGHITIGIGHNLGAGDPKRFKKATGVDQDDALNGQPLTQAEIDALFADDLDQVLADLEKSFDNFDGLPDNVKLVLADVRFQVGAGGFAKFKDFKNDINDADWGQAVWDLMHHTSATDSDLSDLAKNFPNRTADNVKLLQSANKPPATQPGMCE